jgi:hypothetical protein
MERSAINSYTTAGATLGVLIGLWASNLIVGTEDPGPFYSFASILAIPFAVLAYWLISRRYRKASDSERKFHAIFGWVVLLAAFGILLAGVNSIFPKAHLPCDPYAGCPKAATSRVNSESESKGSSWTTPDFSGGLSRRHPHVLD